MRARHGIALGLLALFYLGLSVSSLRDDSVTIDEFGHLPVGYRLLTTGDFRYCTLNPPLMNALSALPLLALDTTPRPMPDPPPIEPGYKFWRNGYAFLFEHAGHYQQLYVASRCVTVALVLLLGMIAFWWAGSLAPRRAGLAGLLAAAPIWLSPNVVAHARLVTTDAGAACFTALAGFAFHAFLRRPTPWRTVGAGVALGLAQLVKFNALLLYPALLGAAWVWQRLRPDAAPRRRAVGLAAVLAISLLTLHAGYLFQGSLPALSSVALESGPGAAIERALPGGVRLPLPRAYLIALDRQLADTAFGDSSYLFGESYQGGRWYYFAALLAVKTPVALLLLAALAVATVRTPRRVPWADAAVVLLPAAALALVLSLLSNKQIGLRMLLPAAPLFWVWAAATIARVGHRGVTFAAIGLLAWAAVDLARIHPHYLAYFNALAGGPSQGFRHAVGSNLDWGQDLIHLKRYLDEEGIASVQLLYYGRVDPAVYGLDYTVPRGWLEPGLLAVSVSLFGRGYLLNDHGTLFAAGPIRLDRAVVGDPPIATIGHTIQLYRVVRGGPLASPGPGS